MGKDLSFGTLETEREFDRLGAEIKKWGEGLNRISQDFKAAEARLQKSGICFEALSGDLWWAATQTGKYRLVDRASGIPVLECKVGIKLALHPQLPKLFEKIAETIRSNGINRILSEEYHEKTNQ